MGSNKLALSKAKQDSVWQDAEFASLQAIRLKLRVQVKRYLIKQID